MFTRKGADSRFWLGLAVVLALHAALAALLWLLRRQAPWARAGALLLGLCGATVALNLAFLVGIPTLTLIERDSRPEVGDLPEACAASGFDMPFAPTPALARAGRVLVRPLSQGSNLSWLGVPGCALVPTSIPSSAAAVSSETGGATLYALMRPPDARYEWFLAGADGSTRPLALDWRPGLGMPVLLPGGSHVAWLERRLTEAGSAVSEPPFVSLARQPIEGGAAARSPLSGLERGNWRLVEGAGPGGPFLIVSDVPREFRTVESSGALRDERPRQPGPELERLLSEVVLLPDGWLGWDVYTEDRRYLVAWDLPGGRGRVEEPKGRGVTAAAADPAGRYVAYSTTTTLSVGSVPDAVALLRATDGSDLWRRQLPRFARAQVALFGDHFAWSDSTSVPPRVRVLRLPANPALPVTIVR
jgi:hypothetical protein